MKAMQPKLTAKPTILVVEDEPQVLELLLMFLEDLGIYEIITATDGQEAVDFIETNAESIDLILLDLMLPKISGMTILQKLRSDCRYRGIKVIVQSAIVEDEVMAFLEKQMITFVRKPFDIRELLKTMDEMLREEREGSDGTRKVQNAHHR